MDTLRILPFVLNLQFLGAEKTSLGANVNKQLTEGVGRDAANTGPLSSSASALISRPLSLLVE